MREAASFALNLVNRGRVDLCAQPAFDVVVVSRV